MSLEYSIQKKTNQEISPSIEKSIPLIENKNDSLEINQSALDHIRSIKGDIAVCVIVGPYRSGKSFLLSRLMSKLTGDEEKRIVLLR